VPHARIAVIEKPLPQAPSAGPTTDADEVQIRQRYLTARTEHEAAALALQAALDELGQPVDWFRAPERPPHGAYDLVVSLGGDGTFLLAARLIGQGALLGVNSSPSTSVGRYCATTAADVLPTLSALLDGSLASKSFLRLRVTIDDVALPLDAINDALFANACPVAATRYAVVAADGLDMHLSSGLWIATPTGSSGAIRSAGGSVMDDDDHRLQWRVREPFIGGGLNPRAPRNLSGFTTDGLELLSRHRDNAVYLDGQHTAYTVGFGARVRIFPSPDPLIAYLPVSLPR